MAQTTHGVETRNGLAEYIRTQLDNGSLEIQTSEGVGVLATMALGIGAYSAPTTGVITALNTLEDTNANAGTATWAQQKSPGGTVILGCDVSVTGGNGAIQLSSVNFDAGDTVRITSLTYTAPN